MFIVMEIQTLDNGQIGTLVNTYEDGLQAESKYHTILASAAISALPKHSAIILDEEGQSYASQCYKHGEGVE